MTDPIATPEYRWTDARLERLATRVKAEMGIAADAPSDITVESPEWLNAWLKGAGIRMRVLESENAWRTFSLLCFDDGCRVQERGQLVRARPRVMAAGCGGGFGGSIPVDTTSYEGDVGKPHWIDGSGCIPYASPFSVKSGDACSAIGWSWENFFSSATICHASTMTETDRSVFTTILNPAAAYVQQVMQDRFQLPPPYEQLEILVHPKCLALEPTTTDSENHGDVFARVYGHQMEVYPRIGAECDQPAFPEKYRWRFEEAVAHEFVHNFTSPALFDRDFIFDEAIATYVQLQYRGTRYPQEALKLQMVNMPLPPTPTAPLEVFTGLSKDATMSVNADGTMYEVAFKGCKLEATGFLPGAISCRFTVNKKDITMTGLGQACARMQKAGLMLCLEQRGDPSAPTYDAKFFSLDDTVERSLLKIHDLKPGELKYSRANVVWDGERVYTDFMPIYSTLEYEYPLPSTVKTSEQYSAGLLVLLGIEQLMWQHGAGPNDLLKALGKRAAACFADVEGCPQFVDHLPALTGVPAEELAPLLAVVRDPEATYLDIRICRPE